MKRETIDDLRQAGIKGVFITLDGLEELTVDNTTLSSNAQSTLASDMKHFRKKYGISQYSLALHLKCKTKDISQLEKGLTKADQTIVKRFYTLRGEFTSFYK